MIRYLAIRNLAVIESVAVEFEPSFNALTGETGAGKSILVGAVGLLLGGRASADLVRTGEEMATVEALFETGDGREVTVRREITAQGRSRAFIDGQLATATTLRELAAELVELHGQHEHQALTQPDTHLPLLDEWAGLAADAAGVAEAWGALRAAREQLDRATMDSRERAARLELVEFQLKELDAAAPRSGEDEELQAARDVLRHADSLLRLSGDAYAALYDGETAALVGLGQVWRRVGELAAIDATFQPYAEARDAIKAQLEDLALALRDYHERIDASPARLQEVEDRLALVERLKRKYGPALEDVLARHAALKAEHAALTGGSGTPDALRQEVERRTHAFTAVAGALSRARRSAGLRLTTALQQELAELAMPHARVELRFAPVGEADWSERGLDRAEFYLSPNPGEDLRPLARIASGGELSRIMLALKTLAAGGGARTMVFDEVDAGIGGRVATVVGEKLGRLGATGQVLCITHLPQIAAAAATHFHIDKQVRGTRTVTTVRRLTTEDRVEELARMMAGGAASAQVREGARELLAGAGTAVRPTRASAASAPLAAQAKATAQAKAKGESPGQAKAKGRRS